MNLLLKLKNKLVIPILLILCLVASLYYGYLSIDTFVFSSFYLITITLILLLIFNFIIYRYYSETNFKVSILFSILLVLSLIKASFGIDTTDHGYMLSKSWSFFSQNNSNSFDLMWGASWILSLWLHLLDEPNLLWARILYSFLSTLNVTLILFLVIQIKGKLNWWALFIIAIVGWIYSTNQITIPNYNSIPLFLITCSFYFFLKESFFPKKGYFYIISGVLLGFSIHTRVPNILFLLFPLCVFIYIGLYKKKEQEDKNILSQIQWKKYLLGIIIGILLGVLIILLLGKISILFDNVLASLMTSASQEAKAANETDLHSITSIVKKFVIQSSRVGFIFISIFTIQEILILQSKKKFLLIILFVMALISVPFIPKLKILVSPSFHFYVLGLIVFFYYYYFRFSKSSLIYSELFLTLTTIFIAIISSLGSDLGFKTILNSGGIVWPMVLSLYFIFRMQLMKSISYKKVLTFSLLAILVFYSLLALVVWKPYRDSLKGSLQMGSQGMLKGTTSSKDRILVLQDLCDYMSLAPNFSKANLLVLNSAPLLYYMLDKDMPIANEWGPWIFLNPLETIKSLLSKYDSEKGYVILAVSAQRSNWPHLKEPTVRTLEKKKYEYVLSWLLENGYTPVHSNQSFVVYSN